VRTRFELVNVIHPSTNRARCRITTWIVTNALPLHQTDTCFMCSTEYHSLQAVASAQRLIYVCPAVFRLSVTRNHSMVAANSTAHAHAGAWFLPRTLNQIERSTDCDCVKYSYNTAQHYTYINSVTRYDRQCTSLATRRQYSS